MSRLTHLSLAAIVLLLGAVAPWHLRAQGPGAQASDDQAIAFIASRHGVNAKQLRLASRTESRDAVSGAAVALMKVVDTSTGRIYAAALDASGASDLSERTARWRSATARRRALRAEGMWPASSTEAIPVVLWLEAASTATRLPSARTSRRSLDTQDEVDRYVAQVDAALAAGLTPIVAPVAARLRERGFVPQVSLFSPTISVTLPASAIAEIAAWPEVDRVYTDELAEPELLVARATLKASIVNNRGRNGTGVRIGMVEVGGRIATNTYLELSQDTTFICGIASTHSTGVAGLINSNHPVNRGVAAGALLWAGGSCSGLSSQLQDRSNAAGDWGARAINLSWGTTASSQIPGSNDRFYDSMVINRRIFVVKSSGNRAGPCVGDGKLTSPGLAYNVLTVGGFDDRNTVDWGDDIMDDCSSYVDPISLAGDREKPEVVAPSMNMDSTTTDGGVGLIGSGTSWSSALVTGVAALLMHRDPTLQVWPEALKAILMATAIHNVEGDRRLSDKDGAGGLSVDRADDVARRYRGDWDGISFTCDSSTLAPPLDIAMSLVAGRRTRAVIAWDTDPTYADYESQPGADLDLAVLAPAGGAVATSTSLDNTYEIVDFVPTVSGSHTLRITTGRCDLSPHFLGWAWWRSG